MGYKKVLLKGVSFMDMLNLQNMDIVTVLSSLNDQITKWAEQLSVPAIAFFIAGIALAAIVGFFSFKLIKLLLGAGMAAIGYYIGGYGFFYIADLFKLELPDFAAYIAGGIVALLFFLLAFKKFSHAMFVLMGVIGYVVTSFYIDNTFLEIGGAILLAFVSMFLIRFAFIVLTAFPAGMLVVSFLSAILPDVALLDLSEGWIGLAIAGGVALVFTVVQLIITRKDTVHLPAAKLIAKNTGKRRRRRVVREF